MASKSKKRRRVLGASCILAALIIAGSSFAWFTSKDEVTNRLTANSDYGVSIVESFVPPENMIPGQTVNKDVYAVNTGTIGAFVKETVSGKLTYTYEKRVATAPTKDANTDYVKLNNSLVTAIDGATTNEAGGYLAYFKAANPAEQGAVELGPVNSATKTDEAQSAENADPADNPGKVEGTRWHPTKTGVYIFRRSYVPEVKGQGVSGQEGYVAPADAYYTYAGYYYVAADNPEVEGDYYKIVIGDDDFRAKDTVGEDGIANFEFDVSATQGQLGKNVTIDKDGKVTEGNVAVQYVKEVTKTDVTPTLTYHKTGSGANPDTAYLEATYTDSDNENSADYTNKQAALNAANQALQAAEEALLTATGQRAIDEVAYENALGAYNTAKSRYDQTKADYEYAKAMKEATDALYTAANNRATAEINKDQAIIDVANALKALKDEADKLATDPANATDNTQFGDVLNIADTNAVSFTSIFGGATVDENGNGDTLNKIINTYQDGHIDTNSQMLADVREYRSQMYSKWEAIKTQSGKVKTALGKLQTAGDLDYTNQTRDDGDQAQTYLQNLKDECDALETLLSEYYALYHAMKVAVDTSSNPNEALLTALSNDTADTIKAAINTLKGRVTSLKGAIDRQEVKNGENVTTKAGLAQLVDRYEEAYDKYIKQTQVELPKAEKAWEDAVKAYNKAVQNGTTDGTKGAALIYQEAIQTEQMPSVEGVIHKNEFEGLTDASNGQNKWLTDNGKTLVSYYSAEKKDAADNAGDPTIKTDTDDYKTLWKTIGKDDVQDHMSTTPKSKKAIFTPAVTTPGDTQAVSTYTQPVNNGISAENVYKQLSPTTGAKTLDELKKALDGTQADDSDPDNPVAAVDGLKKKMEDALKTYNDSKKAVTDAEAARNAKKTAAYNAAEAAEAAAEKDESQISFIIYLDDTDPGLNWTSELGDNESAESAAFYYNYILEAGQTSDKLIDAVKLSPKVTSKDYKSLTFDLNVGLDSAQVTYEADQKTISAVAVNDNDAFKKTAEVEATVDGKTPVKWSPAAKDITTKMVYKVGPYELASAPATLDADAPEKGDYVYSIVVDGKTYYGKKDTDGEKYYLFVAEDNTDPEHPVAAHVDTTKSVTLNVTEVAE